MPAQSCSRPRTQPSSAHLHGYGTSTSPPPLLVRPCKASQPGHGLGCFSLISLLQPRHPALHPGVPWAQQPRPPPWSHRTPNTLPSPKHAPQPPRGCSHLPRDSPPRGGSPRGSHRQHPSQGEAQHGAGEWLQLCLPLLPLPLARMLGGNHRPYLAMAILTSGNVHRPPSRAAWGGRRPVPASHHPILHRQPLGNGHFTARTGWEQKKGVTSSPCYYL